MSTVLEVGRQTLRDGGLFNGSFHSYEGYWFSITVWCTIGSGLWYVGAGLYFVVINLHKNSKYPLSLALVPAFSALYGVIVGFTIGCLCAAAVAAMYETGPYEMQWIISAVWGLGFAAFHVVASFARGILSEFTPLLSESIDLILTVMERVSQYCYLSTDSNSQTII